MFSTAGSGCTGCSWDGISDNIMGLVGWSDSTSLAGSLSWTTVLSTPREVLYSNYHVLVLGILVDVACCGDTFCRPQPAPHRILVYGDAWLQWLVSILWHLSKAACELWFQAGVLSCPWLSLVFSRYLEISCWLLLAGWSKLSVIGNLFLSRRPMSNLAGGRSMSDNGVVR